MVATVMHFAFAIDVEFVPYATVAIRSLLNHAGDKIHLHFLHEPGWQTAAKPLLSMLDDEGVAFSLHCVDADRLSHLPITDHVSVATYYRLCIAELLPESVTRVIYLDADLIVRKSPMELWNAARHPSGVAAVPEPNASSQRLGFDAEVPYLNAGVLVIDLDTWRANRVTERLFEIASVNLDRLKFWDQDVLALYLAGEWTHLSAAWNLNHRYFFGDNRLPMPSAEPAIVHFSGAGLKPWNHGVEHPFAEEFWELLQSVQRYGICIDNPNASVWERCCQALTRWVPKAA